MTTTQQQKFTDLVDQVIKSNSGLAPAKIADMIVNALDNDPDAVLDALRTVMPFYVTRAIGLKRNGAISALNNKETNPFVGPYSTDTNKGPNVATISPKIKAAKAWDDEYQKFLSATLHVASGSKALGNCTRADLLFAVTERETHIASVQNRADLYRKLAELLPENNTMTLADLDPTVVKEIVAEHK